MGLGVGEIFIHNRKILLLRSIFKMKTNEIVIVFTLWVSRQSHKRNAERYKLNYFLVNFQCFCFVNGRSFDEVVFEAEYVPNPETDQHWDMNMIVKNWGVENATSNSGVENGTSNSGVENATSAAGSAEGVDDHEGDDANDTKYNAFKGIQNEAVVIPSPEKLILNCVAPSVHPHPTDCTKYYQCFESSEEIGVQEYDCPRGKIFDPSNSTCSYPTDINPSRDCRPNAQPANTTCSSDGYFVQPDDCSKYFRCVGNDDGSFAVIQFECADGKLWNPNIIDCSAPHEIVAPQNCKYQNNNDEFKEEEDDDELRQFESRKFQSLGVAPMIDELQTNDDVNPIVNTFNTTIYNSTDDGGNFVCPGEGVYPDPSDCSKYILCGEDGFNVTLSCIRNEAYNAYIEECSSDWSACRTPPNCTRDDQRLADPKDNEFYFNCAIRGYSPMPIYEITKQRCPSRMTFDAADEKCVPAIVVIENRI